MLKEDTNEVCKENKNIISISLTFNTRQIINMSFNWIEMI